MRDEGLVIPFLRTTAPLLQRNKLLNLNLCLVEGPSLADFMLAREFDQTDGRLRFGELHIRSKSDISSYWLNFYKTFDDAGFLDAGKQPSTKQSVLFIKIS